MVFGPEKGASKAAGGHPPVTLEDLAPRSTPSKKAGRWLLAAVMAGILVFSYVWCEISPMKLWHKRQNAVEYLFGRPLTESDRQAAWRQAQKLPELMAHEQARSQVLGRYRELPSDQRPGIVRMNREIDKLGAQLLAAQAPERQRELVQEEYARIVEEKKGGYFPPDIRPDRLRNYAVAMLETLMIAVWGSLLAMAAAIPLSLLAAKNTLAILAPGQSRWHRMLRWLSYSVIRRVLDSFRGFDMFVMALIFVAIIGLGPFAGILALFFHTTGILGKVFAEALEAVDPGQMDGVLSTGGGAAQTLSFAALPQVLPTIISYSLLRFESNVRSATILGFCGAGGIGFLLFDKLRGYLYHEVCTMMIMIILAVTAIDFVCAKLRKKYI